MSAQIDPGNGEQGIARALKDLTQKRPVLEPILRSFGEIMMAKARLVKHLESKKSDNRLELDSSRLLHHTPLLSGLSLEALQDELSLSFGVMLTVLKQAFSHLEEVLYRLEAFHREYNLDLSKLSRAYLDGNNTVLREAAQSLLVPEGILALVTSTALGPVLEAVAFPFKEQIRQANWFRGYCPICGSMPSISFLSEVGDLGSEFLRGGGGQRYLHCSMCGCEWRIMRNVCPACENEDKDLQFYFQTEDDHSERVDVCRNCGGYLPCLDLRQSNYRPPMDIAAVGMLHLDAWASEKGYHPLARTPWNRVH